MSTWKLRDLRPRLEGDDDGPVVEFNSPDECRQTLLQLSGETPGVFFLKYHDESKHLKFGLGPRFGFLHWWNRRSDESGPAIASPVKAAQSEWFVYEGSGDEHTPEELIPIDQVIKAVIHMIRFGKLDPRISWRIWDSKIGKWTELTGA